jgi:hypothetical protein
VTVAGFALAVQGAAMLATGLALLPENVLSLQYPLLYGLVCLACLLLAGATLLTGLSFLRQSRHAWLNALSLQGLTLLIALLLYWRGQRTFSYPLMLFGLVMVLYLNRADVLAPFHFYAPAGGNDRDGD